MLELHLGIDLRYETFALDTLRLSHSVRAALTKGFHYSARICEKMQLLTKE
jgi:hypothetical protein